MKCPFCSSDDTRVIDSRLADNGDLVRRRRDEHALEGDRGIGRGRGDGRYSRWWWRAGGSRGLTDGGAF